MIEVEDMQLMKPPVETQQPGARYLICSCESEPGSRLINSFRADCRWHSDLGNVLVDIRKESVALTARLRKGMI